jgi:integrase
LENEPTTLKPFQIVRWLQDEFSAAARHFRPSYVKLLRIAPTKLHTNESTNIEEFRNKIDPSGSFYTESEMLDLYQTEYGVDRKAKRNQRLRLRILKVVRELAPLISSKPTPADLLQCWFDEQMVERFAAAQTPVINFQDLMDLIERRGKYWHRFVPKIGLVKAARIEAWLSKNGLLPDEGVIALVNTPGSQQSGIVPLELFIPPFHLSGERGTNRCFSNKITANNDLDAIEAWLASRGDRPHTIRSYRTNVERFLLWIILEKGKALSSATIEDCTDCRNFLGALEDCGDHNDFLEMLNKGKTWSWNIPLDQWVGPSRGTTRRSKYWKPFNGKLAKSSQSLSLIILTTMGDWLTRQKYLESNPFDGVASVCAKSPLKIDHALTPEQWQLVIDSCEDLPKNEAYFRLRFALIFAYGTGLRLSELKAATVGFVVDIDGQDNHGLKPSIDGNGWDIEVVGKRKKIRQVPISNIVMLALQNYMEVRGFNRDPDGWPENTPLIATLSADLQQSRVAGGELSPAAMYNMFVNHFKFAARRAENERDAGRLNNASTHWLRHTFATQVLNNGGSLDSVQEILGHASPATTALYLHASRKRKLAAVEIVFQKP